MRLNFSNDNLYRAFTMNPCIINDIDLWRWDALSPSISIACLSAFLHWPHPSRNHPLSLTEHNRYENLCYLLFARIGWDLLGLHCLNCRGDVRASLCMQAPVPWYCITLLRLSGDMNKSILPGWTVYRYRVSSLKLILDLEHSLLMFNICTISVWCQNANACVHVPSLIHSFIPDIYIAPLQETYSEGLSVQLRPKRKYNTVVTLRHTVVRWPRDSLYISWSADHSVKKLI